MPDWLISGWTPVLLIAGAVLLFNLGLIYSVLSGSAREQMEILRKVADQARNPWKDEDQSLGDLRRSIERLEANGAAKEDAE